MIKFKNSLFVHTPKTGGSWVKSVLSLHGGSRYSYAHDIPCNNLIRITADRLSPFMFVRHPLCFVFSLWNHWTREPRCRINNINRANRWMWDKSFSSDLYSKAIVEGDFSQTLENFTSFSPGFVSALFSRFMFGTTFVGKYENLRNDLIHALKVCNPVHYSTSLIEPGLVRDIRKSPPVNFSPTQVIYVNRSLLDNFMSSEPMVSTFSYDYVPPFFLGR